MMNLASHRVSVPKQILREGVVAACLRVGPAYDLHEEEALQIGNTVAKRFVEFSAGRACARLALAEFDISNTPILISPSREPVWPNGFVGSLSHSDDLSVSVIARQTSIRSVGIDLEPVLGLEESLWNLIARPDEQSPPISDRQSAECLRYSCKEAVFKCWFTAGGNRILDFDEVFLNFNGTDFTAYVPAPVNDCIHGKWTRANNHYWTFAWLD